MSLIDRLLHRHRADPGKNPTPEEIAAGLERARAQLEESDATLVQAAVRDVHRAIASGKIKFDDDGEMIIVMSERPPDRLLQRILDALSESGINVQGADFSYYRDFIIIPLENIGSRQE